MALTLQACLGDNFNFPSERLKKDEVAPSEWNMGYGNKQEPWIPVGVGVYTGIVFFGTISGSEGSVTDLAALGNNVNITARIASKAGSGEALVSEVAYTSAGLNLGNLEQRQLELKGKSEPIDVRVLQITAG